MCFPALFLLATASLQPKAHKTHVECEASHRASEYESTSIHSHKNSDTPRLFGSKPRRVGLLMSTNTKSLMQTERLCWHFLCFFVGHGATPGHLARVVQHLCLHKSFLVGCRNLINLTYSPFLSPDIITVGKQMYQLREGPMIYLCGIRFCFLPRGVYLGCWDCSLPRCPVARVENNAPFQGSISLDAANLFSERACGSHICISRASTLAFGRGLGDVTTVPVCMLR